ncbi:hypothetical protein CYMTET_3405 [Cymbomonas tetramitiformis]|uniref:Glycosyltransferase n=1 Tax=Cymbomonas tetramitiformis TaxID=36881 RepID=A0AAE0H3I1_9CHLO|nr:hypothetical protein CYMTET_3405 [Cymbomonas tetramitiformis]
MKTFVRTHTGRIISLEMETSDSVDKLKAKIQDEENVPPHQQRLLFDGICLEHGRTLASYSIQNNSTLYLERPPLEFAFATVAMLGHLIPLIPMIDELLQRGHAITIFHDDDPKYRRKLVECGLQRCVSVENPAPFTPPASRPGTGALYGNIVEYYAPKDRLPDVIVFDFFAAAAADAADLLGVPAVCVFPNVAVSVNPWAVAPSGAGLLYSAWCFQMHLLEAVMARVALRLRNGDRRGRGLPPMREQDIWPCRTMQRLTIGCTGVGLEEVEVSKWSPLFQLVGPALPKSMESLESSPAIFQWITEQTLPVVYVAFGTFFKLDEKKVQQMQMQLLQLPVAVIWSLPVDQQQWLRQPIPAAWRVETFVPQVALLASGKLRVFVSHCGSNSIYEALLHHVPIVCCPGSADQPPNATRLAKARVGVLAPKGLQGVAQAIKVVLEDEAGFRARSKDLCRSLSAQGGMPRAATIIENAGYDGYAHLVPDRKRASWLRIFLVASTAGVVTGVALHLWKKS